MVTHKIILVVVFQMCSGLLEGAPVRLSEWTSATSQASGLWTKPLTPVEVLMEVRTLRRSALDLARRR